MIFLGTNNTALNNAAPDNAARTTGSVALDIGLISMLVLIAAVGLLFTGRYPRGIYDAVIGLNRWVLRVVAYVTLMTDTYPPFRLDQGGAEPAPLPPSPTDLPPGAKAADPRGGEAGDQPVQHPTESLPHPTPRPRRDEAPYRRARPVAGRSDEHGRHARPGLAAAAVRVGRAGRRDGRMTTNHHRRPSSAHTSLPYELMIQIARRPN